MHCNGACVCLIRYSLQCLVIRLNCMFYVNLPKHDISTVVAIISLPCLQHCSVLSTNEVSSALCVIYNLYVYLRSAFPSLHDKYFHHSMCI